MTYSNKKNCHNCIHSKFIKHEETGKPNSYMCTNEQAINQSNDFDFYSTLADSCGHYESTIIEQCSHCKVTINQTVFSWKYWAYDPSGELVPVCSEKCKHEHNMEHNIEQNKVAK